MFQMTIGNANYQCLCVRYVSHSNTPLIIGLCVGLGLLLIIIIVAVIAVMRRRRPRSKTVTITAHKDQPRTNESIDMEQRVADGGSG